MSGSVIVRCRRGTQYHPFVLPMSLCYAEQKASPLLRLNVYERLRKQRSKERHRESFITTNDQLANLSWCQASLWDPWPILLLYLIIFRQLRVCWCGAPSLTRGWVRSFQLLLGMASAVLLGRSPAGLMSIMVVRHYIGVWSKQQYLRFRRRVIFFTVHVVSKESFFF
jgi:hypothetical protein